MEASYALTAFAVGIIVSYLVAEFIGRQKHIGGWWTFFLVLTSMPLFLIPGLVAVISSPNAKSQPTQGNAIRTTAGVVLLIWGILLLVTLNNTPIGFYWQAKVSFIVMLFPLGFYLYFLGQGLVINRNPKFRQNIAGNWLSSKVEQAKKSVTLPDIRTEGKSEVLYYIVEDDKPVGPLTLQQIKDKQPKAGTLVCRNGEQKWSAVEEMKELYPYVIFPPPPIGDIANLDEDKEDKKDVTELIADETQSTDKEGIEDEAKKQEVINQVSLETEIVIISIGLILVTGFFIYVCVMMK